MDPVSSFALACSVIQVVDFGLKTISKCREIASHGTTAVNLDIEYTAGHMKALSEEIQLSLKPSSPASPTTHVSITDRQLQELAVKCVECANELGQKLEKLKLDKTKDKLTALRKALELIWKQGHLKEVRDRLESLRRTLDTRLLARLFDLHRLHVILQHADFETLNKASQDILNNLNAGQRTVIGLISAEHSKTRQEFGREFANVRSVLSSEGRQTRSALEDQGEHTRQDIRSEALAIKAEVREQQGALHAFVARDSRAKQLKASLWFSAMKSRQQMIATAHKTTFEWILGIESQSQRKRTEQRDTQSKAVLLSNFEGLIAVDRQVVGLSFGPTIQAAEKQPTSIEKSATDDRVHASNAFVTWLQEESGIYWITGKAGSGKSTLMNVIVEHPRTSELLQQWSKSSNLLKPAFFFWNSGSDKQKSVSGCLQSLIYQCLEGCPALVETLLEKFVGGMAHTDSAMELQIPTWTLGQLTLALNYILTQTVIPCRYCFFLDGLDELDGPLYELLQLLRTMVTRENVKMCVASRPLYDFSNTFRDCLTLKLENFTMLDMNIIVEDRLLSRLSSKNKHQENTVKLCNEIVQKSDGVFLWLILALRELEQGLEYMDSFEQLQARLENIPGDLDKMYFHLVAKIPKVYKSQSANLMRHMLLNAKSDASPSVLHFTLRDESALLTQFLEAKDLESMWSAYRVALPGIARKCEETNVHLKTRCAGLLDVASSKWDTLGLSRSDHDEGCRSVLRWWDYRVTFLHPTLKDFLLETDAGMSFLDSSSSPSNDALLAQTQATAILAGLAMLMLEMSEHNLFATEQCLNALQKLNKIFGFAGNLSPDLQYDTLIRAERLFTIFGSANKEYPFEFFHKVQRNSHHFEDYDLGPQNEVYGHAAWLGLTDFILRRLKEPRQVTSETDNSIETYLLGCAMDGLKSYVQNDRAFPQNYQPPCQLMKALLAMGADPNAHCPMSSQNDSSTIWQQYIATLCSVPHCRSNQPSRDYADMALALVSHGADVGSLCYVNRAEQEYGENDRAWKSLKFLTQLEVHLEESDLWGENFLYLSLELVTSPMGALYHFDGHLPWYVDVAQIIEEAGGVLTRSISCEVAPRARFKSIGSPWRTLPLDEADKKLLLECHSRFIQQSDDKDSEKKDAVTMITRLVQRVRNAEYSKSQAAKIPPKHNTRTTKLTKPRDDGESVLSKMDASQIKTYKDATGTLRFRLEKDHWRELDKIDLEELEPPASIRSTQRIWNV